VKTEDRLELLSHPDRDHAGPDGTLGPEQMRAHDVERDMVVDRVVDVAGLHQYRARPHGTLLV
jgi:hypothetical protein